MTQEQGEITLKGLAKETNSPMEAAYAGKKLGEAVHNKLIFSSTGQRDYGQYTGNDETRAAFEGQMLNTIQLGFREQLKARGMSEVKANRKAFKLMSAYERFYDELRNAGLGLEPQSSNPDRATPPPQAPPR